MSEEGFKFEDQDDKREEAQNQEQEDVEEVDHELTTSATRLRNRNYFFRIK